MNSEDYEASIVSFFLARGFDIDKKTDLFEAGAIDSMDIVELVVFLETELKIKLDVSFLMADNFRSLDSILELIKNASS